MGRRPPKGVKQGGASSSGRARGRTAIPIDSVRHKDKRANIPTQELSGFVAEDEKKPQKKVFDGLLYARDETLDPQLVWKGKDEQDRNPLEVPVVPIYIQEKIQPQVIVEEVRAQAKRERPDPALSLFADFNGIDFDRLVEFYQHEQNWSNRMILGDSLVVMTSLAEKEGLKGKVQMIYMDPPYGIKFGSNWQVSTRKRDVKDSKVEDATRQPEQVKAFRDTWELGIHSYLSYMRDRLIVARELLTETGSVFVQIGDENVHLVRCVIDEVFGSDNAVCLIPFIKTTGKGGELLDTIHDYLLWYAKDRECIKYWQLYGLRSAKSLAQGYTWVQEPNGSRRRLSKPELEDPTLEGRRFIPASLNSTSGGETTHFSFELHGKRYRPAANAYWKTNLSGMERLRNADRLLGLGATMTYVRFDEDFPVVALSSWWGDTKESTFAVDKIYVVQTYTKVIERCTLMTTDPGDLVLDPTCGSGTTAYVAEQWGRRWITIDTSRVALALARARLMAAKYDYYILADSPEGLAKEAELTGHAPPSYKTENDVRKGFVYKRVPHVTLKSIANNPDIREGMTRETIDAAIARHAETELLYDQPYEDAKRVRVAGPFTVESLSPHRMLPTDEERPATEVLAKRSPDGDRFETMILDNLRKAGVQNTKKNERLVFERLEPFPGAWIHGDGEYTEKSGLIRRVAVSIGPEHGTVGGDQIKDAAKEALKGRGFDILLVCGFAFDARAGETANEFTAAEEIPRGVAAVAERSGQLGRLPILLARMNPDLAMGDELLKKTGAGNLFMVFGEPDITIHKEKDGKISVEIRGVDVYDPTTGAIRSNSTSDIACWFIDTAYNEESFFVRHAYFTGDKEPYERLKRALRAEIDEGAWSALYSTRSIPFDRPKTGKIAVKVINHYGDEVLKVYET